MKQINYTKKYQKRLIKIKGTEINRIFYSKSTNFILQSTSYSLVTDKQLKAAFNCMKKKIKKSGHLIIHVFPVIGLTKKPVEVRMGKGKGSKISKYTYAVRPGKVLFEIEGLSLNICKDVFQLGLDKLNLKGKIIPM